MPSIQVVVLAAGMGTRLGRPLPKPLTPLDDGRTIIAQQLDNVREVFGADARVVIVVGFKLDAIMEAVPDDACSPTTRTTARRTRPRAC